MANLECMDDGFPSEIQDKLTEFDEFVTKIDSDLQSLHSVPLAQTQAELPPLDKAKLELIGAYTINSLFWMYLNTQGINPKENPVKHEIDRIRGYMTRVKEIQDKAKAPVVNVPVAKKFVRNALWAKAHKQTDSPSHGKETGVAQSEPLNKHIRLDSEHTTSTPKTTPDHKTGEKSSQHKKHKAKKHKNKKR